MAQVFVVPWLLYMVVELIFVTEYLIHVQWYVINGQMPEFPYVISYLISNY